MKVTRKMGLGVPEGCDFAQGHAVQRGLPAGGGYRQRKEEREVGESGGRKRGCRESGHHNTPPPSGDCTMPHHTFRTPRALDVKIDSKVSQEVGERWGTHPKNTLHNDTLTMSKITFCAGAPIPLWGRIQRLLSSTYLLISATWICFFNAAVATFLLLISIQKPQHSLYDSSLECLCHHFALHEVQS